MENNIKAFRIFFTMSLAAFKIIAIFKNNETTKTLIPVFEKGVALCECENPDIEAIADIAKLVESQAKRLNEQIPKPSYWVGSKTATPLTR